MSSLAHSLARPQRHHCENCWHDIGNGRLNDMMELLSRQIWCKACYRMHPAIFFTQSERVDGFRQTSHLLYGYIGIQVSSWTTSCIRAEGAIRVCRHKSISYDDMCSWKAHMTGSGPPSISPRPFTPWACTECLGGVEDVPCVGIQSIPRAKAGSLSMRFSSAAALDFKSAAEQPKIDLGYARSSAGIPNITKSWRIPIFYIDQELAQPITSEFIQDALQAAHEKYNPILCPHVSFTDGSLLDALQSSLKDINRVSSVPSQQQHGICNEPAPKMGWLGWFQGKTHAIDQPTVGERTGEAAQCLRIGNPVTCFHCIADYSWSRKGDFVFIEGHHNFSFCKLDPTQPSMDMTFINAMDPESYSLGHDTDLKHVTWCPNRDCVNGRNFATHLSNLLVMNQICEAFADEPPPYGYAKLQCQVVPPDNPAWQWISQRPQNDRHYAT
jgi:hypothetical protein